MNKFKGIGASVGISHAKAYILEDSTLSIEKKIIDNTNFEIKRYDDALIIATGQINNLKEQTLEKLGMEKAMVFDAHLGILMDPEMRTQVKAKIELEKTDASFALSVVANEFKSMFSSMEDPYMQERAADVGDVTTRIIKIMEDIEIKYLSSIDTEVIIVSHDLTPSETSQLNPKFTKGFITEIGGKTSHSAIMARSLEIPAIVGIGKEIYSIKHGDDILMDGHTGEIFINPTEELVNEFKGRAEKLKNQIENQMFYKDKETITLDGWKTKVASNIGSPSDIPSVLNNGADGVGLFRSEFLYMDAKDWPTEEEQFKAYKEVLEKLPNQKVVIRTLDIGGDKTLNYYKFPHEMNPFLGYRAIRLQLDQKDIFETQIRALLRASHFGKLAINIPMIATIDEFKEVKSEFKRVEKNLKSEGIKVGIYELGVMVEVPAVVELIDKFAKYADFFSIGSNDLIQYTFAADRMSESVSYLYQPYNPSTLRKIKRVIDESHKAGIWTALCGEMAGDPLLTPILVGMGLDEFSMSSSSVLEIRKLISKIEKSDSEKLVEKVLDLETQDEVIELITNWMKEKGIEN